MICIVLEASSSLESVVLADVRISGVMSSSLSCSATRHVKTAHVH